MTRQRYFVTCAMAFAVAGLPFLFVEEMMAAAQERTSNGNTTGSAVPRGDGDGGGSAVPSGGGGSSGGGSSAGSGSSGGGGSVGGADASGYVSPPSPAWPSAEAPRRSDDQGSRSRSGGASTGTATPRSAAAAAAAAQLVAAGTRVRPHRVVWFERVGIAAAGSSGLQPSARRPTGDGRSRRARHGAVVEAVAGDSVSVLSVLPLLSLGLLGTGIRLWPRLLYYDPLFGGYGYGYGDPGYYGGGGGSGGYSVSQSYRDERVSAAEDQPEAGADLRRRLLRRRRGQLRRGVPEAGARRRRPQGGAQGGRLRAAAVRRARSRRARRSPTRER